MARRFIPCPSRRCSGRCRIKSVSFMSSRISSKRWWGRWPVLARAWQPHNPNYVEGARARQRPSRQPAPKSGWKRNARRYSLIGICSSVHLFIQRHVSKTERKLLWRITRGLPHVYMLRVLMDQVYALFDRRCRTQTALDKLAKLRRRLLRFTQVGETLKKLFSPTLEKALTFLDDKLLPATSNAVERGNRRYRKMQRSVYRVRTQAQIRARLALDMWREAHAEGRQHTLASLHRARAG